MNIKALRGHGPGFRFGRGRLTRRFRVVAVIVAVAVVIVQIRVWGYLTVCERQKISDPVARNIPFEDALGDSAALDDQASACESAKISREALYQSHGDGLLSWHVQTTANASSIPYEDAALHCELEEMNSTVDTLSGAYSLRGCMAECGVEGIDRLCFDQRDELFGYKFDAAGECSNCPSGGIDAPLRKSLLTIINDMSQRGADLYQSVTGGSVTHLHAKPITGLTYRYRPKSTPEESEIIDCHTPTHPGAGGIWMSLHHVPDSPAGTPIFLPVHGGHTFQFTEIISSIEQSRRIRKHVTSHMLKETTKGARIGTQYNCRICEPQLKPFLSLFCFVIFVLVGCAGLVYIAFGLLDRANSNSDDDAKRRQSVSIPAGTSFSTVSGGLQPSSFYTQPSSRRASTSSLTGEVRTRFWPESTTVPTSP